MKLSMIPKGNKFHVVDERDKTIYTIKKKALGSHKYVLYDKNSYELYVLQPVTGGKRASFKLFLNEKIYLDIKCTSMFLEPSIEADGEGGKYVLKSADRKEFDIYAADRKIGHIKYLLLLNGDKQLEMDIDEKDLDDFIPLLALCIDLTFTQEK